MNSDSDNDEGFVANKITIADASPRTEENKANTKPLDYQPRYIFGDGFIRYIFVH